MSIESNSDACWAEIIYILLIFIQKTMPQNGIGRVVSMTKLSSPWHFCPLAPLNKSAGLQHALWMSWEAKYREKIQLKFNNVGQGTKNAHLIAKS